MAPGADPFGRPAFAVAIAGLAILADLPLDQYGFRVIILWKIRAGAAPSAAMAGF
jgi:hypothetical protein